MSQSLGTFLRDTRKALGFSLRHVAQLSGGGISHTYLGDLEREVDRRTGKVLHPSPLVLQTLAHIYGVDYGYLMHLAGYDEGAVTTGATTPKGDMPTVPSPNQESLASVLAGLLLERQRESTLREEKEKIREEKEREAQANERLRIEKEYALRERELEAIRIPEQQRFTQIADDLHRLVLQLAPHSSSLPDESEAAETSYGR